MADPQYFLFDLGRNKMKSFKGIEHLKHLKRLTCLSAEIEQFPE